ncbi:MAG: ribosome biogenesis GTPase Der [Candidatus Aminicenantes bacterium]|nr:MAG: ribosome biogenesis GTPase Der [Candidatus Aminicenantes bacterium]
MIKVAIVGFPNVGKSTLFNRLLKQKKSLVHSLPGMTRDQIPAFCRLAKKSFILIDTGGFFDSQGDPFSAQVKQKAWEASQIAEVLLFVLDGKRGMTPGEEELFFSLKKMDKPIFVVINKIDTPREEDQIGDFYRLGKEEIIPISAEHNRNLGYLEERIIEILPDSADEDKETELLKIAIVGRINVGKSSVVNRLSGEKRLIVSEIPGTTRDSTDTLIRRNKKTFCLIDTAGIRKMSRTKDKREKAGIIKAKKDIGNADVVCLILDAMEFPTRQDTAIAHIAHDSGKPLILALNKWDLIQKETQSHKEFRDRIYRKLDFVSYAPLVFISALSGQRVVKILDLSEGVLANGKRKISTPKLNKFLKMMNTRHPPVSRNRKKIKLKYMVQKGILPPSFILFTHSQASLDSSYEKFFLKKLYEEFDFLGTPLRVNLKKS